MEVENLYVNLTKYLGQCMGAGAMWGNSFNVARAIPILRSFLTESFEKQATYYVTLEGYCPKWMDELGGQVQRAAFSHMEALGIARDLDAQELQGVASTTVSSCVEIWKGKREAALLGSAVDPNKGTVPVSNRRGYRPEVQAWMKRTEIGSQKQAARRLGISIDVLKSIMSDKGRARYSQDTLQRVLDKILPEKDS